MNCNIPMRIQTRTRELHRRRAVSGVVVMLILVGVGAGMTFAALSSIQDNLGGLTGSNHIQITRISAYTDNDRLVISGDVKNLGSQALTSVMIDEISAGELLIVQNPHTEDGQIVDNHGDMTISGLTDTGVALDVDTVDYGEAVAATTTAGTLRWPANSTTNPVDKFYFRDKTTAATGVATVQITGLSTDENGLVSLAASESNMFRIVVTGISVGGHADVLDILRSVPSGSDLFITLVATDGQSVTVSDPRTTQVKAR